MRNLLKVTLALGLAALVASPALAQGRGGRGGRGGMGAGGGATALLMQKSVQEELKVTEDQLTKVQGIMPKIAQDMADDLAKMRAQDTTPEERAAIQKKMA